MSAERIPVKPSSGQFDISKAFKSRKDLALFHKGAYAYNDFLIFKSRGLKMNKFVIRLLLAVFIISASAPVFAQKGWRLFPGTEEDFELKPTVSAVAGVLSSNSHVGDTGTAYGVEASFMCPLIQNPTNNMRQQVSVVNYTDGDNSLLTAELNLHYRIAVADNVKIGVGPGLGYVRTDAENVTTNMLALQAGASFHYTMDKIFIGAEYRYQVTQSDNVGKGRDNGADNWRALAKVGYNF